MTMPPFVQLEIAIPEREAPSRQRMPNQTINNDDSISSELSLDLLAKERAEELNDSKLQSSSGSCRWNPDDSDYSLNVLLLPPKREESPKNSPRKDCTTSNDDSVSGSTKDTLGSDYSLNKLRAVHPKNGKTLDACSCHSTLSVDTEFSVSRTKLPENIELKKPKASTNRETKVTFYPRVRIQRVPPRKNIPKEEMNAVWYSRDEFHVIRQECFKTIRLMDDDVEVTDDTHPLYDEDDNELCRRGLEYKTQQAYKRRQKQKKEIRTVVFEELDFQEEQGMNDPEWLAKLSRDQSRSCVEAAILTALEDERQARMYLGR